MTETRAAISRRRNAGFWSSSASFFLPLGPRIDPEAVKGYPIDMRVKAGSADWFPGDVQLTGELHVEIVQYALGCYERWLAGEGEAWLQAALKTVRHLVEIQREDGSWAHDDAFPHTFPVPPGWVSGITQGEGASLLTRLHSETGDPEFASAARRALRPLSLPLSAGGLQSRLDGARWYEEFPSNPPSYVLNGNIFALWGWRDVAVAFGDSEALAEFETGVDALAQSLSHFDTGFWSLYSLFPHPIPNVASSFYHALHITQLEAMQILSPRQEIADMHARWKGYQSSASCRRRAFAAKAAFRLLVPRNRLLARRLPWTRM